jgi:hypothetical protein
VATLPRDGPLPTLRAMIASGRRLVVLDERDRGDLIATVEELNRGG